jgi:hypothetical protein
MMNNPVTKDTLVRGGKYNWKWQPERLEYLRQVGSWFQFALTSEPTKIWCEVLERDLVNFEESK